MSAMAAFRLSCISVRSNSPVSMDIVTDDHTSFFFFQAEDGIRDDLVTGVQTCALPIYRLAQHTSTLRKTILLGAQEDEEDRLAQRARVLLRKLQAIVQALVIGLRRKVEYLWPAVLFWRGRVLPHGEIRREERVSAYRNKERLRVEERRKLHPCLSVHLHSAQANGGQKMCVRMQYPVDASLKV